MFEIVSETSQLLVGQRLWVGSAVEQREWWLFGVVEQPGAVGYRADSDRKRPEDSVNADTGSTTACDNVRQRKGEGV